MCFSDSGSLGHNSDSCFQVKFYPDVIFCHRYHMACFTEHLGAEVAGSGSTPLDHFRLM